MTTKGFAQYELIRAAAIEDTIVESESNICVDITWNTVDKILETPPLISAATLVSQEGRSKKTQALYATCDINHVKDRK